MIVAGYGFEHRINKLHIQWIELPQDQESAPNITTVPVAELNENPWYVFGAPVCLEPPQCASFDIKATHTYELSEHKFKLMALSVGKYALTKQ